MKRIAIGNVVIIGMVVLISAVGIFAQNGKSRGVVVKPVPPTSTGSGIGGASGGGIGRSTGAGLGGSTGAGVGSANGSGAGAERSIVILSPSESIVFRNRRPSVNATDVKLGSGLGTASGNGVGSATEVGSGDANGSGMGESDTRLQTTPQTKREYIKEMNGGCFYVTNLGMKVYVAASKCVIE
ncbi:MAG: hypothetical protein QM785_13010 [Pyrinomonadaceae bacterium]